MKRQIPGLHRPGKGGTEILEGLFLVRVERASYHYRPQKPFFALQFSMLEPHDLAGAAFSGRLYCSARALWKLRWFLRDFGYDAELLGREEVDERALVGLRGVVKVSQTLVNGRPFLNLDGFAPQSQWEEIAPAAGVTGRDSEHLHDL